MTIRGVVTVLVTPFNGDGLDLVGLRANIGDQLAAGIDALAVLGFTSEGTTIAMDERAQIIQTTVSEAKGRVPIIVGIAECSTSKAVEMGLQAKQLGGDFVFLCMPAYNKPTQEGMVRHIEAVAQASQLPIILYTHPGRTVCNLLPETLLRVAKNRQIVGIKEGSENMEQIATILNHAPEGFSLFSADDYLTLPIMALGGCGVFSVISNLVPKQVLRMVRAFSVGQLEEARKTFYQLLPLIKAAFIETNPIPIKAMMALCGKPAGPVRLPLCELRPQNLPLLEKVLEELQLLDTVKAGR